MKVIVEKHNDMKVYRTTCWNCGSLLEYILNDIEVDEDGKHVICPICSASIPHSESNISVESLGSDN